MTTATRPEYRIETSFGYYSAFEKIGPYSFPESFSSSYRGATVYDTPGRAKRIIAAIRAKGHHVSMHAS